MADELATGPDLGTGAADAASVIELREDSLIKAPGLDKPVAYKDYISGYVPKSDLTRMRQQDATALRQQQDAITAERAQLQRAAQQLTQRLNPQSNQPQADPFKSIRGLQYVDGEAAAGMMQQVAVAFQAQQQRYDGALRLLQERLERAEQGYTTLQGRTKQADTNSLFDQTRQKLGLSDNPQVRALIESEYLAHDGWDTVSAEDRLEHLANVVKQRYEGLQTLFKTDQQRRVDEARQQRLRPQTPTPFDPKARFAGKKIAGKSAEDLASELWPLVQPSPQT